MRGLAVLALLVAGCGSTGDASPGPSTPTAGCQPVAGTPALATQQVASGLERPLDLQAARGDGSRVFVVEQPGRVRVLRTDGTLLPAPLLDITDRIGDAGSEQGLLGLAMHPSFTSNGRFFVNYTDTAGDTHIAEFHAPNAGDVANPASERALLTVQQPFANHNGGGLAFGPDGYLYIGLGDGGSGGDPLGNGQNLATPLGKLLRIDVDRGEPFGVPSDNPFVARAGALPAIWAYGLRNPWRFSFDRATGNLLIGDVGQDNWEEIDLGLAARRGGENYGWNVTEGRHCYAPASGCSTAGQTLPIVEYGHDQGCAVTGGIVYNGCRMPGYLGTYFYSDFCSHFVRSFRIENGAAVDARDWTAELGASLSSPSAFGVDDAGEIYIVDLRGSVHKIVPRT